MVNPAPNSFACVLDLILLEYLEPCLVTAQHPLAADLDLVL